MGQPGPESPPLRELYGLKSQLPLELQRLWSTANADRLQSYHKMLSAAETLLINWLFALTTGTLAGGLTFASSHGFSDHISYSLICSGCGIICLLIRATWSYYRAEFHFFGAYRRDVAAFDSDKLSAGELLQNDRDRAKGSHLLHALGWLSGILLLGAFWFGFMAICEAKTTARDYMACARPLGFCVPLNGRISGLYLLARGPGFSSQV
jgi:hypothetical protein